MTPQLVATGELVLHPDVRNYPYLPEKVDEDADPSVADWAPGIPWQLDDQFWMLASRNYYDLSENAGLTLIASYIDFHTGEAFLPRSGLNVPNNESRQEGSADAWSLELRLDGSSDRAAITWLTGIFLSSDYVNDVQLQYFDTISAIGNVVPGVYPLAKTALLRGEQKAESAAAFASGAWSVSEAWGVTAGLRYTEESRDFRGCGQDNVDDPGIVGLYNVLTGLSLSRGGTGGGRPGECFTLGKESRNPEEVRNSLDENNVSGKVSLQWTPADEILFYLSYSRGFKSGSFPLLGATEGEQYDPVVQEQLDAVEMGGKTGWFDGNLRINFAVFDYDYTDKQLLSNFNDPIFGPLPKLFNVPKSRIIGAEIELQAQPSDGLFVSLAASALDTEINEFVGTTSDGREDVDFSGNEINFAPESEVTLLVRYEWPVTHSLLANIGGDYSYTGDATSDLEGDPLFLIPSYDIINLRAGIGDALGRWKLSIWGKNITDNFYLLSTPSYSGDSTARFVGMTRTYGVTLSFNAF